MSCALGFPLRFQPLERLWRGFKRRNPTARFASGGGLETFSSLLAVSPRAGSGNNLLSRSRGNRHGRLGRNSLSGDGYHCERKNSTGEDGSEGKFVGWKRRGPNRPICPFLRFFISPGERALGGNAVPSKDCDQW